MSAPAELPAVVDPAKPLVGWSAKDAIDEMEAACRDASSFLKQASNNEKTRKCWWPTKTGTGKKEKTKQADAKPFNGAADHEVHLTQTVMNRRNAARTAALAGGALAVTPMESTDGKQAGLMRQVLRYYLNGPMRTEFMTQGLKAGSYADRFRASLLYVGWKEERGVEAIALTSDMVGEMFKMELAAVSQGMMIDEGTDYAGLALDPAAEETTLALIQRSLQGGLARQDRSGLCEESPGPTPQRRRPRLRSRLLHQAQLAVLGSLATVCRCLLPCRNHHGGWAGEQPLDRPRALAQCAVVA